MSREFDNTNRGVLFRNERKETDNHPDYKGSVNVGGVEFWLAAWIKTSGKGNKFMSLAVTPKDQGQRQDSGRTISPSAPAPAGDAGGDMDDDIPF